MKRIELGWVQPPGCKRLSASEKESVSGNEKENVNENENTS